MYRTLSTEYDKLYQQHLETFRSKFAETYPDPSETEFTDFYPALGVPLGADVDFLVYGQAVGGWHDAMDLKQPVPKERYETSKTFSNHTYGSDSPIDWVNARWCPSVLNKLQEEDRRAYYALKDSEYWANKSFFWQLTTKIIQGYYGTENADDWGWSKQLVWSNLYKIARQKENPMDDVKVLQRSGSVELVKRELDELRPKYCLVITSEAWWAPFRRGIGSTVLPGQPEGPIIQSVEEYGPTKIIVIHRPFVGNSTNYAKEVLGHLS